MESILKEILDNVFYPEIFLSFPNVRCGLQRTTPRPATSGDRGPRGDAAGRAAREPALSGCCCAARRPRLLGRALTLPRDQSSCLHLCAVSPARVPCGYGRNRAARARQGAVPSSRAVQAASGRGTRRAYGWAGCSCFQTFSWSRSLDFAGVGRVRADLLACCVAVGHVRCISSLSPCDKPRSTASFLFG